VQEAALAPFLEACAAVDPLKARPLSSAHASWIAEVTAMAGGPSRALAIPTRGPDTPLARAHLFAPVLAVVAFARDEDLAEMLSQTPAPALGLFGGDPVRARSLLTAFDHPLAYVNDDGLGPLVWPPPDLIAAPLRRILWGACLP
jgi:acyl-CoA reductase-like NAD-dependent aldehyde dehydrogenase